MSSPNSSDVPAVTIVDSGMATAAKKLSAAADDDAAAGRSIATSLPMNRIDRVVCYGRADVHVVNEHHST